MTIYATTRPLVKLFPASDAETHTTTTGAGMGARFEGDGTLENGRFKVTFEGQTEPVWWIVEDHLRVVDEEALRFETPKLDDLQFFRSASLAAQTVSGFRDAGGMSVEYLLLLAWAESGWTNTDSLGRDGEDADFAGPFGPFRFDRRTWAGLMEDNAYKEILRGFTEADRIAPTAQCAFAAAEANRIQFALKKATNEEPPAWVVRLGRRIGQKAIVRFVQLANDNPMSTNVGEVSAVSAATVNANPKLFPNKSQTTRGEVFELVKAEFESGKRALVDRLGKLIQVSFVEGMIDGSSSGTRNGVLGLLDFIGQAESRGDYNAVVHRPLFNSGENLVAKTIAQVLNFQDKLSGDTACGKYQVIKDTLRRIKNTSAVTLEDLFDEDGQDKIGHYLLMEDARGNQFLNAALTDQTVIDFARRLTRVWAALPVLADTDGSKRPVSRGESYYAGVNGNGATVSADAFEAAIRKFRAALP